MTDFIRRFAHLVDKTGDCWVWTGHRKPEGYGYVDLYEAGDGSRRRVYAHRAAIDAPAGLVVRHLCHNPPCVNPAHLATGTQADNAADMVAADRSTAQIPAHLIPSIRACVAAGVSGAFLAKMSGISASSINRIARGSRFKTLPGDLSSEPRNRGEGHRSSVLTESLVREIRSMAASGSRQTDIARAFGVTPQAVNQIIRRKAWRHVA